MSGELEGQYRRALVTYPRAWRRANADVVVGTLLDIAEGEGRSAARGSELLNLAANGLATSFTGWLPTAVKEGVGAVALAAGTAMSLMYVLFHSLAPWADHNLYPSTFGVFLNAGFLITALWATAFILRLSRQATAARWALAASVVLCAVLGALYSTVTQQVPGPSLTNLTLFATLAVLAMLGRSSRRRPLVTSTLLALAIAGALHAAALAATWSSLSGRSDRIIWQLDGGFIWAVIALALVIAGVLLAIGKSTAAAVTAISAVPWALALTAFWWGAHNNDHGLLMIGAATVVLSGALVMVFRLAGIRVEVHRTAR